MQDNVLKLAPLVQNKTWFWNQHTKKLQRFSDPGMDPFPNWITSKLRFRCQKWHGIFWDLLSSKSMVHSHCQECWKVCMFPRDFAEVISIYEYQSAHEAQCKVGMDMREYTKSIWGAYWYNRSIGEATKRHAMLTGEFPDAQVIIKRGCTEFELLGAAGDSQYWIVTKIQREQEIWLDEHLDFDPFINPGQNEAIRQSVIQRWMVWAHQHGDMSYLPYRGMVPVFGDCRSYV